MRIGSRQAALVLAAMTAAAALQACGKSARQAIGIERAPPDEFAVMPRAPLTMPPDFGLRPPAPGTTRPQEGEVKDQARQVLVQDALLGAKGPKDGAAGPSSGEAALLGRAGAAGTDPAIRAAVDGESQRLVESERSFVDKLVFWQNPAPPGTVLDAEKESRRLRENAALGEPPVAGPTPVIKRRERGWLEGIF